MQLGILKGEAKGILKEEEGVPRVEGRYSKGEEEGSTCGGGGVQVF